jgi:hypothetical protein
MYRTIDHVSCIRWVLGFGIKTGYGIPQQFISRYYLRMTITIAPVIGLELASMRWKAEPVISRFGFQNILVSILNWVQSLDCSGFCGLFKTEKFSNIWQFPEIIPIGRLRKFTTMLVLSVCSDCIRIGVKSSNYSGWSILSRIDFQQPGQLPKVITPKLYQGMQITLVFRSWSDSSHISTRMTFSNSCSQSSQIWHRSQKFLFDVLLVDSKTTTFCDVSAACGNDPRISVKTTSKFIH